MRVFAVFLGGDIGNDLVRLRFADGGLTVGEEHHRESAAGVAGSHLQRCLEGVV